MSEERRRILNMLAEGKVTVDDAERLLRAVGEAAGDVEAPHAAAPTRGGKPKPKYLRVEVDAPGNGDGQGRKRVNVRVPLALVRAGMKLKGIMPDHARAKANAALAEHGVHFKLDDIGSGNLEEMIEALQELTVDVEGDEGGEKVRIYCE